MGKPELFSYLSAFITIVLAVALGDMIQSVHRLLRARSRVVWDARPLVMAAIIAVATISEFFSLWIRFDVTEITMVRLLWLLATPTLFALLAYAALPDQVPAEGLDLAVFWRDEHRYLAVLWILATLTDLSRSVEHALYAGRDFWRFVAFSAPMVVCLLGAYALLWWARGKVGSWISLILLAILLVPGVMFHAISVKPG